MRVKALLLWLWREVPFPSSWRRLFLRLTNPSWMVGAMALIQDEQGRVLLLEHTYRRTAPWGLPGGWLKRGETPEAGVAREVYEETSLRVQVEELLGVQLSEPRVLDLMYRCRVLEGTYRPTVETSGARWADLNALPALLVNQERMLRRVGLLPPEPPQPGPA